MVELKKNKKALESQKLIYKSLRRILLTKPLSEITVTDIKEDCNISRTTFYRNFKNVIDVLDVMFDYFYCRYLDQRLDQKNQLLFFFEYWGKHKDLVHIITHQIPSVLKNCIKRYTDEEYHNPYFLDLKFAVFSSIICRWSESKKETPVVLETLTKQFFNKKILEVLLK